MLGIAVLVLALIAAATYLLFPFSQLAPGQTIPASVAAMPR